MSHQSKWLSPSPRKPRKNWKRELELERARVIDEAIERIRLKLRSEHLPESFKRGHYAAITELEIMKNEKVSTVGRR